MRVDAERFPHCDTYVLHAPGECDFCDMHPERQADRTARRVAFTGHAPFDNEEPCPSDARRGRAGAHVWPGNRPTKRDSG